MDEPVVSVIICNHNYGRYLAEAVDSALGQSYSRIEVIVIDDGSTDDSEQVLSRYRAEVRAVLQKNRGISAARNCGIAESRGELIAFLDADDVWLSQKLVRQVELFKNPRVGMVYCGLQYIDAFGRRLGAETAGQRGRVLRELALLEKPGVPASGSSPLIRKEVFEKVGRFDERLSTSADWDMWRRISCHYEIEICREPLVLYRQHERAMHRNVELFERDVLRAFRTMFEDPAADEVHPLRRQCYANLYMTLAGSYFQAGNARRCLYYLVRGLLSWPPSISRVLGMPLRRISRAFEAVL